MARFWKTLGRFSPGPWVCLISVVLGGLVGVGLWAFLKPEPFLIIPIHKGEFYFCADRKHLVFYYNSLPWFIDEWRDGVEGYNHFFIAIDFVTGNKTTFLRGEFPKSIFQAYPRDPR